MNFNKWFEQECEETFWDLVSNETTDLMKTDREYKKSISRCADIIDEFPNLKLVLEDNTPVALSQKEVTNLIEFLTKSSERNIEEKKQLCIASSRNTFFILQKMRLLKDNNESD